MADFILEFLSEEIPARFQRQAVIQLKQKLEKGFEANQLKYSTIKTYVTPRRLTAHVQGLDLVQPDVQEVRKGPKIDAPEKAIQGFLQSVGRQLKDCRQEETPKGTFWVVDLHKKGQETKMLLPNIILEILTTFSWPKSMRWGSLSGRWVRPIRSILAVLDGKILPFEWNGVKANNTTKGHRYLSPDEIQVSSWAEYSKGLNAGKVTLDQDVRLSDVREGVQEIAKKEKSVLPDYEGLYAEVAGLLEHPWFLLGVFDEKFLDLPSEVLETTLRVHQRYFLMYDQKQPTNKFVVVTNMPTVDKKMAASMRHGYEKVLHARLEDAAFYWHQDQKKPLSDFNYMLKESLFHKDLGTLWDKKERLCQLIKRPEVEDYLALQQISQKEANEAANLCKADLCTGMVYEFPELQGVMGGYYAKLGGSSDAVADAISTQYLPAGPETACPTKPLSAVLSLLDKVDTLVGFFAKGLIPTGSKDPFALRRAALSIIRLCIENNLPFSWRMLFAQAYVVYVDQGFVENTNKDDCLNTLDTFMCERLRQYFKDKGEDHKIIEAALKAEGLDILPETVKNLHQLKTWLNTLEGVDFLQGFRRINNITRGAKSKETVKENLLKDSAELALWQLYKKVREGRRAEHTLSQKLEAVSTLTPSIETFFDQILVNDSDEEVKQNRLALLLEIRDFSSEIIDFYVLVN